MSKNPRVDKGPQSLMFNPALTTCASERMKTQRFSYFADFAARERMREAKPVKLKKVAFSHFFDTLGAPWGAPFCFIIIHSSGGKFMVYCIIEKYRKSEVKIYEAGRSTVRES